jgi:hypothetical protein
VVTFDVMGGRGSNLIISTNPVPELIMSGNSYPCAFQDYLFEVQLQL